MMESPKVSTGFSCSDALAGICARPFLAATFLVVALAFTGDAVAGEQLRAEKLAEMDQAIEAAIASKRCPGGVLWVEHAGQVYHKAYGNRALVPEVERMTEDTIFDAAS